MDTLLARTTPDERRDLFVATGARMGISEHIIEKDFWVCWTLRRLFSIPKIGAHLTFKGGTSLSKAYALIERFSEDVDLTLERSWLGVADAPTGSPRQWLNKLKDACRSAVSEMVVPALEADMKQRLSGEQWSLIAPQKQDEDPRELLFRYPSVLSAPKTPYVGPEVKMEFSARSEIEPAREASVRPYAAIEFPDVIPDAAVPLRCLDPERTLFEKATLLQEELQRPFDQGVRKYLSRHYYDLAQMVHRGVAASALAKIALYDDVVRHRSTFFKNRWMGDYAAMRKGPLILQPTGERLEDWYRDYAQMEIMLFRSPPDFSDLLATAQAFAERVNTARGISR